MSDKNSTKLLSSNPGFNLSEQKYPPILSADEEHELAVLLHEKHDLEAARKLVLSHVRFVVFIAYGYRGYGLEHADLVQEGVVGLMKAVKKFNPYRNVRLSSFAVYWIRAEIHEFIFKNWKIVKIATTKAQRKLFFKLRKATAHLYQNLDEAEAKKIAHDLGVEVKDVMEMQTRLQFNTLSYEGLGADGDLGGERYLEDKTNPNPEQLLLQEENSQGNRKRLFDALSALDARSLDILQSRYLKEQKKTLDMLAKEYGVSIERIRQVEKKAMLSIKAALET